MSIPDRIKTNTVREWANYLPYANLSLLARETFELVEKVTESDLSVSQRIEVLDIASEPANQVLKHIKGRLASNPGASEDILRLGELFCDRLTGACEQVTAQCGTGFLSPTRNSSRRPRAMAGHYLLEWQLLRAIAHRSGTDALWHRLKKLNDASPVAIEPFFAHAVAFSLADTQRLTAPQMQQVFNLLAAQKLEKLVRIGKPASRAGEVCFFVPDGDYGPELGPMPNTATPVDLALLVKRLHNRRPDGIDPHLLQSLLDRWSGAPAKKSDRVRLPVPLSAPVLIGLHHIVRRFSDTPLEEDTAFDIADMAATQAHTLFSQQDNGCDVQILDVSDKGCRLTAETLGAQAGDIIAVQCPQKGWRVGNIAWVSHDHGTRDCGVRWLMAKPKSVSVRFDASDRAVPALYGRSFLDRQASLLYSSGNSEPPPSCRVKYNGNWQRKRLLLSARSGLNCMVRAEPVMSHGIEPGTVSRNPVSRSDDKRPSSAFPSDVAAALSALGGRA